jgi:hypothetical protein
MYCFDDVGVADLSFVNFAGCEGVDYCEDCVDGEGLVETSCAVAAGAAVDDAVVVDVAESVVVVV